MQSNFYRTPYCTVQPEHIRRVVVRACACGLGVGNTLGIIKRNSLKEQSPGDGWHSVTHPLLRPYYIKGIVTAGRSTRNRVKSTEYRVFQLHTLYCTQHSVHTVPTRRFLWCLCPTGDRTDTLEGLKIKIMAIIITSACKLQRPLIRLQSHNYCTEYGMDRVQYLVLYTEYIFRILRSTMALYK